MSGLNDLRVNNRRALSVIWGWGQRAAYSLPYPDNLALSSIHVGFMDVALPGLVVTTTQGGTVSNRHF